MDKIRINKDGTLSIVKQGEPDYNSPDLIGVGQYLYRNQNEFTKEQKRLLQEIGYEFTKRITLKLLDFDYCYNILKQLKEEGQSTKLGSKDKIRRNKDGTLSIVKQNDEGYHSKNLIGVGKYLYRNLDKFTKVQIKQLEDIGYTSKKYKESKKEFDEERHDKVVNKVISNKEKSNEREIHELN